VSRARNWGTIQLVRHRADWLKTTEAEPSNNPSVEQSRMQTDQGLRFAKLEPLQRRGLLPA